MDEQEVARFTDALSESTSELRDFEKALRVLSPTLIKLTDPTGRLAEQMEKASAATSKRSKADSDSTETTKKQTSATQKNIHVTEALTETQEELEQSSKALKSAMGSAAAGMADATGKFFDALTSGKEGFDKYGGAVRSAGDAAFEVGKQFGLLGTIIGALVKANSMVIERQLKFIDSTLKATDGMNKISGGAGPSTEALQKLTWATGRSMDQFDKILKPMQSAGKALNSLGGDASKGAENFIKISAVGTEVQNKFRRLGISYDELTQYQADYLTLQRASGRTFSQQEITSGKVQKASLEYVKNLQVMKDLTGEDITQLQAKQKEAASTMQMALIENLQTQKEVKLKKDLEAATKSGDAAQQKALKDQLALLDKQKTAMQGANDAMVAVGRTDLAGPLQSFLEGGTISSELATQFSNLGINLEEYRKQYKAGTLDSAKLQDEVLQKTAKRNAELGQAALASGDNIAEFSKSVGLNKNAIEYSTQQMVKGTSRQEDTAKKRKELEDKQNATDDKYVEARNKTVEAEQKAAVNTDKALASTIDPVLKAMPELATQAAKLTEYFENLAKALQVLLGAAGIFAIAKGVKGAAGAMGKAKDWFGKIGNKPPTPPTPPPAPSVPVGKDGKPLKGAALKSAQAKAARVAAEEATKKAAEEASKKAAQEAAEAAAKKSAGGMASKAASALGTAGKAAGKFARFIPGVGLVAAVGSAAMDAYSGAKDAEGTLGLKPGEKATTGQKFAAGAAGALSGLTFGLISKETIGGALNKGLGLGAKPEEAAKKVEEEQKKKQEEEDKRSAQLAKTIDNLTTNLSKLTDPLQKFGADLDKTKEPFKRFGDNINTLGDSIKNMSQMTQTGAPSSIIPGPLDLAKMLTSLPGSVAGNISPTISRIFGGFGSMTPKGPPSSAGAGGSSNVAVSQPSSGGGFAGGSPNVATSQPSPSAGFSSRSPNVALSQPSRGGSFSNTGAGITQDPDVDPKADTKELLKQVTTKPKNVTVGPSADLSGVDESFLTKFFSAASEYGKPISINSAYRGDKKQAELWVRGRILNEPGIFTPAKPKNDTTIDYKGQTYNVKGSGRGSSHAEGNALDVSADWGAFDSILTKYGLHRPYLQKDPPHVEVKAAKGGLASGPKSGYPAELHGNEIIVPLDPNSILAELGKKSASQAANDIKEKMPNTIADNKNDAMKDLLNINQSLMEMLGTKLDTMINKLDAGNDTQSKILKYSKAQY